MRLIANSKHSIFNPNFVQRTYFDTVQDIFFFGKKNQEIPFFFFFPYMFGKWLHILHELTLYHIYISFIPNSFELHTSMFPKKEKQEIFTGNSRKFASNDIFTFSIDLFLIFILFFFIHNWAHSRMCMLSRHFF